MDGLEKLIILVLLSNSVKCYGDVQCEHLALKRLAMQDTFLAYLVPPLSPVSTTRVDGPS